MQAVVGRKVRPPGRKRTWWVRIV